MAPDFIKRGDSDSTIDCGEPKVKNKFKWYWLDENDISGERIGSYIEKCVVFTIYLDRLIYR